MYIEQPGFSTLLPEYLRSDIKAKRSQPQISPFNTAPYHSASQPFLHDNNKLPLEHDKYQIKRLKRE